MTAARKKESGETASKKKVERAVHPPFDSTDLADLRAKTTTLVARTQTFSNEVMGPCDPAHAASKFADLSTAYQVVQAALAHKTGQLSLHTVLVHPDWVRALSQPIPRKKT
jgi:hypothetical protein